MNKPVKAILLGLFTGILGILASLVPFVLDLEERAGLDWLFTLRGPRTPPTDVVVVAVDKPSADTLGFSVEPDKWPRRQHAHLIDRLVEAGASVIVLDIFFAEARNAGDDAALATAIGKAGNVVLFAYTKKEMSIPAGNSAGELIVQRLIAPASTIARSALALAPFPLPVFPVKVSQFWTFTPATGDLPTLPVVALQLHAATVYPDLLELIKRSEHPGERSPAATAHDLFAGPGPVDSMQVLRSVFLKEPMLARRLRETLADESPQHGSARQRRLLRALTGMYSGTDSRYLNFYGPAQSITTLSYIRVLRPDSGSVNPQKPVDLHGKTVFVGYSERLQPERLDEFYTVFSQKNGVHLSGVEIAATAFANLLENLPVTPLSRPTGFFLIFAWGLLIGGVARLLPALPAVAATTGLAGLYLGMAYVMFSHFAIWPPLLVPLFLQAPFALFSATLWHYLEVRREREHIRTAFGYYLPSPVVDRLASEMAGGRAEGQLMYGICLYSDAEHYTRLSEGLAPEALAELMNRYYESLFTPVRQQQGIISDIVGDAMLAIWASRTPEQAMRRNALEAARRINETLNRPNQEASPRILATRLGLHSGEIMLGSIGAVDHYEYRAVGDIVNSASRIQELNKMLGTRVLLSAQVLDGVAGYLTREVGTFLLRGKSRPLVIHELIGRCDADDLASVTQGHELFAEALLAFRQANWKTATMLFTRLVETRDDDGVSRFYLDLARRYQQNPPAGDWHGVIRLDHTD
ncbi:MAG: adenylate/guanylate cyclase domain-containing protein [Gammaproteobacteria bacterium]